MSKPMDSEHVATRSVLRTVGPLIAVVGLLFVVGGFTSFFAAFGSHEAPRRFWMLFVGMPLAAVGLGITKFAYLGAVSRYVANEITPVGKDVVNYMADGTRGAVRDLAGAIGEGLRGDAKGAEPLIRCHKCSHDNDADAGFCSECGGALARRKACSSCGEVNDPDARFCHKCGQAVG